MVSKTLFATFLLGVLCAVLVESMPSDPTDPAKDATNAATEATIAAQDMAKKGATEAKTGMEGMQKAGQGAAQGMKQGESMVKTMGGGMIEKGKKFGNDMKNASDKMIDTFDDFGKSFLDTIWG